MLKLSLIQIYANESMHIDFLAVNLTFNGVDWNLITLMFSLLLLNKKCCPKQWQKNV